MLLALPLALLLVVTACSSDGQTLKPPRPGATAPPVPTSVTRPSVIGTPSAAPPSLKLTSPAFAGGTPMPKDFTCDGANASPPLEWNAVPSNAVELAITVTDIDAKGFVHWVVAGLPPDLSALGQGGVPEGAPQAKNDTGSVGWTGPCPPPGSGNHHYVFTLYALNTPSNVTDGMNPHTAIDQIGQAKGDATTMVATYSR